VVVATNGYSGHVVPALHRRVVPVASYLIATAPLGVSVARALIPRDRVVSDTRNLLSYFRMSADTRMLFGGRVAFSKMTGYESAKRLTDTMCALFPRLLGTDIDYHWSGNVRMTVDQLPHAGVRDGVHYAMGYCGHGVALSTYLGARVGDSIAGHGDLKPFPTCRSARCRCISAAVVPADGGHLLSNERRDAIGHPCEGGLAVSARRPNSGIRMTPPLRQLRAVLSLAVLLAACGGDQRTMRNERRRPRRAIAWRCAGSRRVRRC
jgi:hypothetical protein